MRTGILLALALSSQARAEERVIVDASVLECKETDNTFYRMIRDEGRPVTLEVYDAFGRTVDSFNPSSQEDLAVKGRKEELKGFERCYKQSDFHLEGCLIERDLYILQAIDNDLKMIVYRMGTNDYTNLFDSFSLNPENNEVFGRRMNHHMNFINNCQ